MMAVQTPVPNGAVPSCARASPQDIFGVNANESTVAIRRIVGCTALMFRQCERARQNATTCSSAVFIGDDGKRASASTAIAP